MNASFIFSTAILFLMMLDPFGNMPVFVEGLKKTSSAQYRQIVLRESCFALIAMIFVLILGKPFLALLNLTPGVLMLSGGLILLLIGINMVFSKFTPGDSGRAEAREDSYIVPYAIPLICGPGTTAMLITMRGNTSAATLVNCSLALLLAWGGQTLILLTGKRVAKILGMKMLDALESLMGLLLTTMATSLIVKGINILYSIGSQATK